MKAAAPRGRRPLYIPPPLSKSLPAREGAVDNRRRKDLVSPMIYELCTSFHAEKRTCHAEPTVFCSACLVNVYVTSYSLLRRLNISRQRRERRGKLSNASEAAGEEWMPSFPYVLPKNCAEESNEGKVTLLLLLLRNFQFPGCT